MYRFHLSLILSFGLFSNSNAFSDFRSARSDLLLILTSEDRKFVVISSLLQADQAVKIANGDILEHSLTAVPVSLKARHASDPNLSYDCTVMPGDSFEMSLGVVWRASLSDEAEDVFGPRSLGHYYPVASFEKVAGAEGTQDICAVGSVVGAVSVECIATVSEKGLPRQVCYSYPPFSFRVLHPSFSFGDLH